MTHDPSVASSILGLVLFIAVVAFLGWLVYLADRPTNRRTRRWDRGGRRRGDRTWPYL